MSISTEVQLKKFIKGIKSPIKTNLYYFTQDTVYYNNCELAKKYKNILLLNSITNMVGIIDARQILTELAKEHNYTVIKVPMRYGETKFPQLDIIQSRLDKSLLADMKNPIRLINESNREQFKGLYKDFETLLKAIRVNPRSHIKYKEFLKQLDNPKYIRQLKLQNAHSLGSYK